MDVKSCAVDWNWRYVKYSTQYLEADLINTMQQVSNSKNVKKGFSLISTKTCTCTHVEWNECS